MDPKQIARRGDPYDLWIAADWSDVSDTKKSGLNQVRAIDVTYVDGSKATMVLDERGQPISSIRELAPDENQQRIWKEQQAAANRPPEERNNNGRRERWNPQTSTWVDVGPAINTGNATTGQQATVRRIEGTPLPGGGFDNTKPIAVNRDANGQQVGPSEALTAAERTQWEREKNPGGLTDQELRERNSPDARVGKPTGNTRTKSENGTTVKETEYLLPDGSKEWRSQTETSQPDLVGKPTGNTRSRNENGQAIKEAEYVLPNGTKEWRTQTAPSETNQPLPAGMPAFRPDPNKEGMGLIEYTQQLTALRSQGKLTDNQFKEFVGLAHQQATAEAARLDTIRSAQAQLQANAINQRNTDVQASTSRLATAQTATQNALETSMKMASNFTPKSYAAMGGPILPALMAIQDARAHSWGGMNMPGQVGAEQYPMLAALQQMGMLPASGAPGAAPVIPAVSALTAPVPPNAIGAGAVPGSITPGDPSGATVDAANQASQAGSQAAFGAAGVPGVPATAPPARDDWRTDPGAVPVNPMPGQPGHDPNAPVGQAPAVLPGVLQAGILAELSGKYPPDILADAAKQLGWG